MDIVIICLLVITAIILFLIELFLIPGIGMAGIGAVGCIIYANVHAFMEVGTTAGYITLVISLLACIASVVLFMRSKTLDKISLKEEITSKVERSDELGIHVGDRGTAITRLALIGSAEINGEIVEVKSADGFLDEKTPIEVTRLKDGIVFVTRIEK